MNRSTGLVLVLVASACGEPALEGETGGGWTSAQTTGSGSSPGQVADDGGTDDGSRTGGGGSSGGWTSAGTTGGGSGPATEDGTGSEVATETTETTETTEDWTNPFETWTAPDSTSASSTSTDVGSGSADTTTSSESVGDESTEDGTSVGPVFPDLPPEPVVCDNGGTGVPYHFYRQEHVEIYLADCDVISVGLYLDGYPNDDGSVSDLSPLAGLVEVRGDLVVRTRLAASLAGLDGLERVDGDLFVGPTWLLTDVAALHGASVGGDLRVENNADLCQARVWELIPALDVGGDVLATTPNPGACP